MQRCQPRRYQVCRVSSGSSSSSFFLFYFVAILGFWEGRGHGGGGGRSEFNCALHFCSCGVVFVSLDDERFRFFFPPDFLDNKDSADLEGTVASYSDVTVRSAPTAAVSEYVLRVCDCAFQPSPASSVFDTLADVCACAGIIFVPVCRYCVEMLDVPYGHYLSCTPAAKWGNASAGCGIGPGCVATTITQPA